ncbi:MAG: isopeptide-forming domain-containing fimbrial protein [Oscillospiraceae bacterium]|nr:isopeptide-forming domain-containing fimbrial protein [Oscillospiraceae bacterium]
MKTKKTFKRIAITATAAIIASCAIVPIASTSSLAAEINITNSQSDHTYEAYQIFAGTLSNDKTKLSSITWGTGVKTNGNLMNDIKGISQFASCQTAADVAEKLGENNANKAVVDAFLTVISGYLSDSPTGSTNVQADGKYTISGLPDGYYFVKDKDDSLDDKESKTYTDYIVEVIGTKTINVKSGLPTFTKTVGDVNDSDGTSADGQTSADYDIGDSVPFHLEATVDSELANYTSYQFTIHDTLAQGLTIEEASIVVKCGSTTLSKGTDYTVNLSTSDSDTFDIVFPNLKNVAAVTAGSTITVDYTAKLGSNAVIGSTGNPNTAYLEYSNNPNDLSKTGKTHENIVKVYTYDLIIDKIKASDSSALAGAEFKLEKKVGGNWTTVQTAVKTNGDATFTFDGIDDGLYKLTETTIPDGYNGIDPICFKVEAAHDENGVTSLSATQTEEDGSAFSGTALSFACSPNAGTIEADIKNQAGSELPSTGSIGTTPFYVGGGILVAAAGVYIIVRRRMKNNDNEK